MLVLRVKNSGHSSLDRYINAPEPSGSPETLTASIRALVSYSKLRTPSVATASLRKINENLFSKAISFAETDDRTSTGIDAVRS